MASITVTGRAAQDAELRFTPSGATVWEMNVAENHRYKDKQTGEWRDSGTTWWRVKAFGRTAEALAEARIAKGTLLLVTGRSETREYEKRDGTKGASLELIADTVAIVPTPTFRDNRSVYQKGVENARIDNGTYTAPSGGSQADPWATPAGDDGPGW